LGVFLYIYLLGNVGNCLRKIKVLFLSVMFNMQLITFYRLILTLI
jgi:hypothetical protein